MLYLHTKNENHMNNFDVHVLWYVFIHRQMFLQLCLEYSILSITRTPDKWDF